VASFQGDDHRKPDRDFRLEDKDIQSKLQVLGPLSSDYGHLRLRIATATLLLLRGTGLTLLVTAFATLFAASEARSGSFAIIGTSMLFNCHC
jgi:hypothetical protein